MHVVVASDARDDLAAAVGYVAKDAKKRPKEIDVDAA
jgi:hypothetical protein